MTKAEDELDRAAQLVLAALPAGPNHRGWVAGELQVFVSNEGVTWTVELEGPDGRHGSCMSTAPEGLAEQVAAVVQEAIG